MPDPFEVLGLPARFDLDPREVESRFRELSRVMHPDKFAQRPAAERRVALGKAVELNEAYRVLRDDLARAAALLRVRGLQVNEGPGTAADPEFLMEVMELREALAEARAARDLLGAVRSLAARVTAMRDATLGEMTRAFAALPSECGTDALEPIAALLARLRYFRRFLDEVAVVEEEAVAPQAH